MINFENLGYKDITKVSPIHFSECFGETFETLYPYEQRFYKKDNDITTILKVGIHNNAIDIAGICYYYNKWHKFEIHTYSDYVEEEFDKTINVVINKLKRIMTQEDKAKAYDKLIKDIKQIIFNYESGNLYNWLKKQDEEKPQGKTALDAINEEKVNNVNIVDTNNIKPKFEIGAWIVNNYNNTVCQIIGCENNTYRIRTYDCIYYQLIKVIDEDYRLWYITDARDGDVLVTGNGNIFIFKAIRDCTVFDYCGLYYGKININASHVNESCAIKLPTAYTPATKEQRNLLMETLNNAGYTFDFDKKEVKKINANKKVILYPFDKVLVRNTTDDKWEAELIVDLSTANKYYYRCIVSNYKMCVPYNKDTVNLLGTTDNSPIDYKIKFNKEFKE